jgi:hypothetical protein
MNTLDAWLDTYSNVYTEPDSIETAICPNCGHVGLKIVIQIGRVGQGKGVLAFWCPACLTGLPPLTVFTRDRIPVVPYGTVDIPEYRIPQE